MDFFREAAAEGIRAVTITSELGEDILLAAHLDFCTIRNAESKKDSGQSAYRRPEQYRLSDIDGGSLYGIRITVEPKPRIVPGQGDL